MLFGNGVISHILLDAPLSCVTGLEINLNAWLPMGEFAKDFVCFSVLQLLI